MKAVYTAIVAVCVLTGCATQAERSEARVESLSAELTPIDFSMNLEPTSALCVAESAVGDEAGDYAELLGALADELEYFASSERAGSPPIESLRGVYAPAFKEVAIFYQGNYSCRTKNLGSFNKAMALLNAEISSVLESVTEENFEEAVSDLNALQAESNFWMGDFTAWIKRETQLLNN